MPFYQHRGFGLEFALSEFGGVLFDQEADVSCVPCERIRIRGVSFLASHTG